MIGGATRGSGEKALPRHLLKTDGGQVVEVMPARHLASEGLPEQINELVISAAHGRTTRPVHHVHIDPPPEAEDPKAIIETYLRIYEKEFELGMVQRAGVFHTKKGRTHAHVVWSLVRDDGSVVSLAHDHPRREKVARIVEFELALPMTKGKHNRSVARSLRSEGRSDVADAMDAAGLLDGSRAVAHSTPRQRAQAERTDVPIDEIRECALAAWKASHDPASFAIALHSFDFSVATGGKGLVLVDRSGNTHGLNRTLAAAARAAGEEKITAAAVRKRLAGITFSSIEETRNGRSRRDFERSSGGEEQLGASAPAASVAARGGRREEPAGPSDEPVPDNPGGFEASERSTRTFRDCLRDRIAIRSLSQIDLRELEKLRGDIMKEIKAQKFKAEILGRVAPAGFNANAFLDDLHMIKTPSPGRSTARIMTRDGGWIELDPVRRSVRTWGPSGRADVLANALASHLGVVVERLEKTVSIAAGARTLKLVSQSVDTPAALVKWWSMRGYAATAAPDGVWIDVGHSRLCDLGDRMEMHGGLTDEAIAAAITKIKDAWNNGVVLDGEWTQAEYDRFWVAAMRAGVQVENCFPSSAAQATWKREEEAIAATTRTIASVRPAVTVAADVKAAAGGDLDALHRLQLPLQAFIASYIDDRQRGELAAHGVAYIIPELDHFRSLGESELAELKRQGKPFSLVRPERRRESNPARRAEI